HQLELRPGVLTIGRSAMCQLVLDDALVSRRHAEITVSRSAAVIRDLGSANGVFVNEKRIEQPCNLVAGDRIVIGKQEMCLRAGSLLDPGAGPSRDRRFAAETLHGIDPKDLAAESDELESVGDSESTHQGDALELLGSVADKVLALGRGAEAERMLSGCLASVLDAARTNTLPLQTAERAVLYAVKLADATGKSRWVDYAVELYRALRRPLPAAAVDQLYTVLRSVSGINLQALREYVAVLRAGQRHFGPNERFVMQRIEGLERLAALK
ncbi:MAG TPA: FHA domain-containing protein, partial [Polyangiaceae bacterium]|nr:FHA domain-containing protein [Polyangiaceae bacterium]